MGSDAVTYEKAHIVDGKGGQQQLYDYLRELNTKNELRFTNMMIRDPELCYYLRETDDLA